jgi:MYXO-CTERM domain-containing protein
MSSKRAFQAAVVVGLLLGQSSPAAAAAEAGDYVGATTAPAAAPPVGGDYVGTSPVAIPAVVSEADSDYAGMGQAYAGIVAAAAGTAPTYAGIGSDYVAGAQAQGQGADGAEESVGRAQRASSSRLPVTSGDVAGLVGMGLLALGIVASLRRRTP